MNTDETVASVSNHLPDTIQTNQCLRLSILICQKYKMIKRKEQKTSLERPKRDRARISYRPAKNKIRSRYQAYIRDNRARKKKASTFLIKYKHHHKCSIEIIVQTSVDKKYNIGSKMARTKLRLKEGKQRKKRKRKRKKQINNNARKLRLKKQHRRFHAKTKIKLLTIQEEQ